MNTEEQELKDLLNQTIGKLNESHGAVFIQDFLFSLLGTKEKTPIKSDVIEELSRKENLSQTQKETLLSLNLTTLARFSKEQIKEGLNFFILSEEKEQPICTITKSKNGTLDLIYVFSKKTPISIIRYFFETLSIYGLNIIEIGGFSHINKNNEKSVFIMANLQDGITHDVEDIALEISMLPLFSSYDPVEELFRKKGLVRYFLRALMRSAEQFFAPIDQKKYTYTFFQNCYLKYPALVENLFALFYAKFHPRKNNNAIFQSTLREIENSNEPDNSEEFTYKDLANFGIAFSTHLLKTNFFLPNKRAIGFRFDSGIVTEKFEKLKKAFHHPIFGIFYIYSQDFFGFHIRFQDIARGGLRTVLASLKDEEKSRPLIFQECYQLAWTQERKNKDIPEGGAKGVIFVTPKADEKEKNSSLYSSQKAYVESLLSLVNFGEGEILKDHSGIVDYYKKEELIFLGPDENMHNVMIEWISNYSKKSGYRPSIAFISGKPKIGINHKEFGVTSHGIHVCIEATLKFLGIDPNKETFTIKMAGGPDGDVAGNEILNLLSSYPKTARILSLIDVSGVIYDPNGLDLVALKELFDKSLPIRFYPKETLSNGGFLLEKESADKTPLIWEKKEEQLLQRRPFPSEYETIISSFIHKLKSDLFFPGGGRPLTLNESNIKDFFLDENTPSSKAIIEGANLYLSHGARSILEKKGVVIIKDSSANKGGVICSSYEVMSGLILSESEFIENKEQIVKEILEKIKTLCSNEVNLILQIHKTTKKPCSEISNEISDRIHEIAHEIMNYLAPIKLPISESQIYAPLFQYTLPIMGSKYRERLIENLTDSYKKAIIAAFTSSQIVYTHGLSEKPSLHTFLPL